jgi:hypothetical protein
MANCSVAPPPKTVILTQSLDYWLQGRLHIAGRSRIPFSNRLNFQKMVRDFVQCTFFEFTLSEKESQYPGCTAALMV